ncbi:hypothetical protein [Pedobacter insulae]|uniref:Uncharacterized protein n=1 Tax=Pedobacter insulae TaxID=414048 RepID=A0A1I2UR98_9SPHI|nr:hypothetical protein [Pedobacter insulae]SFG78789.1 hypothetical protein SAMN04489864_102266 [Pedobacter insulae]
MTFKIKQNLSLVATFAIIVSAVIVSYYFISLKKAPYTVASFKSFTFKWGTSSNLENAYLSSDGSYHYLNNRDSLIETRVKLRTNDIIFIHNKINELGLWELPNIVGKPNSKGNSPVYELQFNYEQKSKKITIYSDFDQDPQLLDSAMRIVELIQQTINEAETRYH